MQKIRVRFAPSPTGSLHIGGVRTALYNYLLAKKLGGTFIVRIEDTDQARFVPGAEEYIFNSLRWLGLEEDESPLKGGPFAPYRQSDWMSVYSVVVVLFLIKGLAYFAFVST
jgi:glutamyl-tRNA synthetase